MIVKALVVVKAIEADIYTRDLQIKIMLRAHLYKRP